MVPAHAKASSACMGSHHLTGRLRGPRNESYKPASSLATGKQGSVAGPMFAAAHAIRAVADHFETEFSQLPMEGRLLQAGDRPAAKRCLMLLLPTVWTELVDADRIDEPRPARDIVGNEFPHIGRSVGRRRLHTGGDQPRPQLRPINGP